MNKIIVFAVIYFVAVYYLTSSNSMSYSAAFAVVGGGLALQLVERANGESE